MNHQKNLYFFLQKKEQTCIHSLVYGTYTKVHSDNVYFHIAKPIHVLSTHCTRGEQCKAAFAAELLKPFHHIHLGRYCMETKPNIIARVIHFLYDREGSKHALINTITNLCSHAITEHLKEEPNRFPSLLFYLVFHCGDIVCRKSLSCDQFIILEGESWVNSADLQRDVSVSTQVNRLLRKLRGELHLLQQLLFKSCSGKIA